MGNQALQELSKHYVRGKISKPEYRQQRQQIIDDITGAKTTEARPKSQASQITPESISSAQTDNTFLKKASVVSAIVVATLILIYFTL